MKNRDQGIGIRDQANAMSEQGFMLLGLIVAIALMLLAMSVAAPIVARSLRRDRDVEAVHRGNQYVRAIQLYYKKFGHYPGSIDQLEKTNEIRFLRQRYVDPITGKDDWRMIPVGQNKTSVKWFFGQPLAGLATTGVGSVGGMLSPGMSNIGANGATGGAGTSGSTGAAGAGGTGGASGATGSTNPAGATGTTGTSGAPGYTAPGSTDTSGAGGSSGGIGSQSAATFSGGGGSPFMGVGLDASGDSIIELNEQTTYPTWEFLYDPRLDQMKAKALAANGAGVGTTPASSFGQAPGGIGSMGVSGTSGSGAPGGASSGTSSGSSSGSSSGPTGTGATGTTPQPQVQQ
jgi:type II secretory pathway pseudopilin PulG